jgi:hypothetical protein
MKKFGENNKAYPAEMRTQNWPLCCGAKIISGFKDVGAADPEELVKQIVEICDEYVPDHQIYNGETINPKLCFLTLNQGQMQSAKITDAIKEAGFVLFAKGTGRNKEQGFWFRDSTNSFRPAGTWAEAPAVLKEAVSA